MAYVIITDQGYEGYRYNEYDTFTELLDDYDGTFSGDIAEVYEVKRDISLEELKKASTARREANIKLRELAVAAARAKLTLEECELLGIA